VQSIEYGLFGLNKHQKSKPIRMIKEAPRTFRHTLTLDNGKENARFQMIEKKAEPPYSLLTPTHLGSVG